MTEKQWWGSDHVAMTAFLLGCSKEDVDRKYKISVGPKLARKLRLFAAASGLGESDFAWFKPTFHEECLAAQAMADGAECPKDSWSWATTTCPSEAAVMAAKCMNENKHNKSELLRHIFGSPFKPPFCGEVTAEIKSLAEAVYSNRRDGRLERDRLMVLADALEEAGWPQEACLYCGGDGMVFELKRRQPPNCRVLGITTMGPKNCLATCPMCNGVGLKLSSVLGHLRSPGVCFPGMWSLDVVLGKHCPLNSVLA